MGNCDESKNISVPYLNASWVIHCHCHPTLDIPIYYLRFWIHWFSKFILTILVSIEVLRSPLWKRGRYFLYSSSVATSLYSTVIPFYLLLSQHFLRSPRNLLLIFFSFSQKFKKIEWIFNFSMEEELDLLHILQKQFCFKHCTFSEIINFLRAMLLPY